LSGNYGQSEGGKVVLKSFRKSRLSGVGRWSVVGALVDLDGDDEADKVVSGLVLQGPLAVNRDLEQQKYYYYIYVNICF
jgi:hypothetical protein